MLAPATVWVFLVPAVTSAEETTKPPSALLGKSVITSWEETRIERKVGAPSFRTVRGTLRVTASIGTDGRILSRYELITNARTFQIEGENRFGSPWTFDGYSMTMIQPFNSVTGKPGAARHIAVSFRDGFAQCSVRSTWAKEEGAETSVTASPYDGARIETRSISTAADRCVVQSGSMFGAR
jgi:hypothetical protein